MTSLDYLKYFTDTNGDFSSITNYLKVISNPIDTFIMHQNVEKGKYD